MLVCCGLVYLGMSDNRLSSSLDHGLRSVRSTSRSMLSGLSQRIGVFIFLTNLYLVRLYGEIEFSFAMMKILLILVSE